MSEKQLKDRNKNPWYILMTFYGKQEGDKIDWELAEKNRKLWNAWICQGMVPEERHAIVDKIGIELSEMDMSRRKRAEISNAIMPAGKRYMVRKARHRTCRNHREESA